MLINYSLVILPVLAWSSWCLEYIWSTKVDGNPSWGVYKIEPLSSSVATDGSVRMIISYNPNPTYVYNANSNDVAATLMIPQGQSSAVAFLSFMPNGTLSRTSVLQFEAPYGGYYVWTDDFLYMVLPSISIGIVYLNTESGQIIKLSSRWTSYYTVNGIAILEGRIYYSINSPALAKNGIGYVDDNDKLVWAVLSSGASFSSYGISCKSNYLRLSGYFFTGNRVPINDLNGNQVSTLVKYDDELKTWFVCLSNINGTVSWCITGPQLISEIQDDGSVLFVKPLNSAISFTVNLNQGGLNVTRFSTLLDHNCLQIWPNGTMKSILLVNADELIFRNTPGLTKLTDGRYLSSPKFAEKFAEIMLYAPNGTSLATSRIYRSNNSTYGMYHPLVVGKSGIAAFSASFKGKLSVWKQYH